MHKIMISYSDGTIDYVYVARIPVAGDQIQTNLDDVLNVSSVRLIGRSPGDMDEVRDPGQLLKAVVQVERE